jgi:hypothetical protein
MLKLTRHLFTWNPRAEYADYYERALYNHILASQNPDDGMVCYFMPLKSGARKTYSTAHDSFWCCVGTGMENHAKYGEGIYFHDNSGLWVNLFIPSELRWAEKGLTLVQETTYPEGDRVSLAFKTDKPVQLALRLRYPSWATKGISVQVNGTKQNISSSPGSFIELNRTWRSGDTVTLTVPFSLRLEALPDNPQRVAVMYGPLVLAGELGPDDDPAAKWSIYTPVLITENKPPAEWLKSDGQFATFRLAGVGKPRDVTLYPYYRMHHKRYAVYWDIFSSEQWLTRESDYKAELASERALEAITVDVAQPGEMQPERDHNMQGERTITGEHQGRKWRHASNGWFSFDLKVMPDKALALICSYWGGETGPRTFDILVDGVLVATQSLQNDKPGSFFDVTYPIPEDLTRGKQKITVRFQARPDNTAGGLYGLRLVQRKDSAQ